MEFLHCTMSAFAVLGKEDSTQNTNKDWIQRLWKDFNEHSVEISQLALRDEQGNLAGFWGAMTDFDRTFQPWGNHLTEGYSWRACRYRLKQKRRKAGQSGSFPRLIISMFQSGAIPLKSCVWVWTK